MIYLLVFVHIIVCIVLILVVLLQQGKGADWAGAFGGGGSQTVFGARGAGTFLTKATTTAAIIFMLTSLTLTIMLSRPGGTTVIRENAAPAAPAPGGTAAPVTPEAPPTPSNESKTPAPAESEKK